LKYSSKGHLRYHTDTRGKHAGARRHSYNHYDWPSYLVYTVFVVTVILTSYTHETEVKLLVSSSVHPCKNDS